MSHAYNIDYGRDSYTDGAAIALSYGSPLSAAGSPSKTSADKEGMVKEASLSGCEDREGGEQSTVTPSTPPPLGALPRPWEVQRGDRLMSTSSHDSAYVSAQSRNSSPDALDQAVVMGEDCGQAFQTEPTTNGHAELKQRQQHNGQDTTTWKQHQKTAGDMVEKREHATAYGYIGQGLAPLWRLADCATDGLTAHLQKDGVATFRSDNREWARTNGLILDERLTHVAKAVADMHVRVEWQHGTVSLATTLPRPASQSASARWGKVRDVVKGRQRAGSPRSLSKSPGSRPRWPSGGSSPLPLLDLPVPALLQMGPSSPPPLSPGLRTSPREHFEHNIDRIYLF